MDRYPDTASWTKHTQGFADAGVLRIYNLLTSEDSTAEHQIRWNELPDTVFPAMHTLCRIFKSLTTEEEMVSVLTDFSIMLSEHGRLRENPHDKQAYGHISATWALLIDRVDNFEDDSPEEAQISLARFRAEADGVADFLGQRPAVVEKLTTKLRITATEAYVFLAITTNYFDTVAENRKWLNKYLARQPVYMDTASNFIPFPDRSRSHLGTFGTFGYFKCLNEEYIFQCNDRSRIGVLTSQMKTLYVVCKIGNEVLRYMLNNGRQKDEGWAAFVDVMVGRFSRAVSHPFSEFGTLSFRQHLSYLNIRAYGLRSALVPTGIYGENRNAMTELMDQTCNEPWASVLSDMQLVDYWDPFPAKWVLGDPRPIETNFQGW